MIDFETEIFDGVARRLLQSFPGMTVTSSQITAPASFPAASLVEAGSSVDSSMSDSGSIERGAIVTYDAYAYSNLHSGAKAEAKKVMAVIDAYMAEHNFTRTYRTQGAYQNNSSVFQVYGRYMAVIGEDGKIYRRA